jgi:hypothetical protein
MNETTCVHRVPSRAHLALESNHILWFCGRQICAVTTTLTGQRQSHRSITVPIRQQATTK